MTFFRNKYRIESSRLKDWDYSKSAIYFVTICTQKMAKYFGYIEKGQINYSKEGEIVKQEWLKSAEIRPYVVLDEYITMPNHFHGIIALLKDDINTNSQKETTQRVVSTSKTLKADSLGSVIGQFKSKCTKRIREINIEFRWQSRFHDRIIRNEKELDTIREYIFYNPLKWSRDEYYC